MLHSPVDAHQKRLALREGLASGRLLRFPGAFNALSGMLIERAGMEGIYVSGAVVSASLGLPDIGLTTASEVAARAHEIVRMSALPTLVDADTGFGEPLNAARTVQVLEAAGASGCHIEDQVNPKRCGHLDGKEVVGTEVMCRRIRAAAMARQDSSFVICARTDARAVEGLDATLARIEAYVDAGADMVFPEALAGAAEIERARSATEAPVLVNLTEFGRTDLLTTAELADLGVNVAIYPVTLLRLAMGAAELGLRTIAREGTQKDLLDQMQTRSELYELIGYDSYGVFDSSVAAGGRPMSPDAGPNS
ncbi:MAG TPA: methylisocitrate lyase [Acidimicrobiales bacterium]|nr:methylisocitrate lyase [Acidimicrobiales bacterium]